MQMKSRGAPIRGSVAAFVMRLIDLLGQADGIDLVVTQNDGMSVAGQTEEPRHDAPVGQGDGVGVEALAVHRAGNEAAAVHGHLDALHS